MLLFPKPDLALQALARLLPACRAEKRIPLTRCGLNHGSVIRRGDDVFGSTVNVASRIASLAKAGQLVATRTIADIARAKGIAANALGPIQLRSISEKVPLFMLQLAEAVDPAWIDPVCKMHAPYSAFLKARSDRTLVLFVAMRSGLLEVALNILSLRFGKALASAPSDAPRSTAASTCGRADLRTAVAAQSSGRARPP